MEEPEEKEPKPEKLMTDNVLIRLRDAFASHGHCNRCQLPMPISEETRDGVCQVCKEKSKEQMEHLGRPPPAF